DLPGQIDEAERIGVLSAEEAAWLRGYDRKVMELIHVDDFATHELGTHGAASLRVNVQIAPDAVLEATL
ncbi:MAG: hypothetical protein EBZ91_02550, partial [Gammaproteobacteria bacterium]|nr:hypothetical protein [Gammaproteobacteria bacterium]